jgi:hypothetical protein
MCDCEGWEQEGADGPWCGECGHHISDHNGHGPGADEDGPGDLRPGAELLMNPVVKLRPVREAGRITSWVVWCETGDCADVFVEAAKASAQRLQRKHAMRHRADRTKTTRRAAMTAAAPGHS